MKTKNKRLLDKEANRSYYSKSDSNYIDPNICTKAHLALDRVAWVREWVHRLRSKYHLDIGTKDGYTCLTLASEGVRCLGIDPSVDAIEEATLRARERTIDAVFQVNYLEDIEPTIKFNTASMMEVLEHVVDVDIALGKLCTLAEYILITTPDAGGRHGLLDSDQNEEHIRVFTQEELAETISKYGEIIELVKRDDQLYVIFKANDN